MTCVYRSTQQLVSSDVVLIFARSRYGLYWWKYVLGVPIDDVSDLAGGDAEVVTPGGEGGNVASEESAP